MSYSPQQDDEWRRLALELGLEPPQPGTQGPTAEPEPPPERTEARAEEFVAEEPAPPRSRRRRAAEDRQTEGPAEAPAPETVPESEGEAFEPEADVAEAHASANEGEPPAESADAAGGKRRRRRGRGRRKKADAVNGVETTEMVGETAEAEEDDPRSGATTEDDEGEDAKPELPADWDVPPWDELIASLYRPER